MKECNVSVSPEAQLFLKELVQKHEKESVCKLFVERGGTPSAETFLSYHYFENFQKEDIVLEFEGFSLHLEHASLPFLQETMVDFNQKEERLTLDSPHAKSKEISEKILKSQFEILGLLIPSGVQTKIPQDSKVKLVHKNPASATVAFQGNWIRISRADAEKSFGLLFAELKMPPEPLDEEYTLEMLKNCYDPEIPVNIVDLGLIYDTLIEKKEEGYEIEVVMTLTAPGCPMADSILDDVKQTLEQIQGVKKASVRLSFEPPWSQELMSQAALLQMGLI